MGYIKEPEGVDFIIQSEPLTDQDRKQISKFIREYKRKHRNKKKKAATSSKAKDKTPGKVADSNNC